VEHPAGGGESPLLLYQMQPVNKKKLGSADEEGDSCHHGVAKRCAKRDHRRWFGVPSPRTRDVAG